MPRQNRVNPFGEIVATPQRGLLMGNRGILHDAQQQIVRPWAHRNWIICALEFRGRRRVLMQPGHYTELFFLDEATALAAGHRPCGECRRAALDAYRSALAAATGEWLTPAAIDRRLNVARLAWRPDRRRRQQRTLVVDPAVLPAGALVSAGRDAWLWYADRLWRWSAEGYGAPQRPDPAVTYRCLTPQPSLDALRHGYRPLLHPTLASV